MNFVIRNPVSRAVRYQKETRRLIEKSRFHLHPLSFSDPCFFLTSPINRRVTKFNRLKTIAIANLLKATAMPIAPVFQILAAVAVPILPSLTFSMPRNDTTFQARTAPVWYHLIESAHFIQLDSRFHASRAATL